MTIRIGNAPCSWGVEFAGDPRNPPWRQVLSDCAEAGYTGIELGPVGFMPEDPVELGEALSEFGMELIGGDLMASVSRPRLPRRGAAGGSVFCWSSNKWNF